MKNMVQKILARWMGEEEAVAAVEAAMIFPIMLTLFMGVYDAGFAILANQKAIRSSQVVADLITRQNIVNATDVDEAIEAGRLAFEPLDSSSYGVDIVSFRFDESANKEIVWRQTENMTPVSNPLTRVDPLAIEDEGAVMVVVEYRFEPFFSGFVFNAIDMQEVAFGRGRSSPVVTFQ